MALKLILKITKENTGNFGIEIPAGTGPKLITLLQARNQYLAPNFGLPSNLTIYIDKVNDDYFQKFGKTENYSQVLADCFRHNLMIIFANGTQMDKCAFKEGVEIPFPTESITYVEIEFEQREQLKKFT